MTISEAPAAPRFSGPRSACELLAEAFEGMERTPQQPAQVPDGHLSTGQSLAASIQPDLTATPPAEEAAQPG